MIPSHSEQNSRGQLILIGGIIIAVILLILVVILNGVMYTENIATKDQPQAIDRAGNTLSFTERTTNDMIRTTNAEHYQTEGISKSRVTTDLNAVSDTLHTRRFHTHAELTRITTPDVQNAWLITQEETSDFTAAGHQSGVSNTGDWTIATGDGVRNSNLTVTSAPTFNTSATDQAESVFQLTVTGDSGTGTTWRMWLYENPSTGAIELTDRTDSDGNPDTSRACTTTTTPAHVEFNPLTIGGDTCDFDFAETITTLSYEVAFSNGDTVSGTYQFVFGKGDDAALGENTGGETFAANTMSGDSPDATGPTAYDAVYRVNTRVIIDGEDVDLDSTIIATPNQPEYTTSSEVP